MKMLVLTATVFLVAIVVIAFVADGPGEGAQFLALEAGVVGFFVLAAIVRTLRKRRRDH